MRWAIAPLCALILAGYLEPLQAVEPRRIVFTGNTVDVGLHELAGKKNISTTETDLEALSVEVTNRYHGMGYTTTHVETVLVQRDGTIEVRIRESKIAGIGVDGISGASASRLKEILVPSPGEVYNRNTMHERSLSARRALGLGRLDISVINFNGGSDVYLNVSTAKSNMGRFSGGVWYEPIYGISPALSYTRGTDEAIVLLHGNAGYRDGEFKKITGSACVYALLTEKFSLFAQYQLSRKVEIWESAALAYIDISHTPGAGVRYSHKELLATLSANRCFISLEGYSGLSSQQSDIYAEFTASYTNRHRLITESDATGIEMAIRGGHGSIMDTHYLRIDMSAYTVWSPFVWMKLRSRTAAEHVTSDERYYWNYMFDKNFSGFPGDYTATKTRFVAGFDLEFETFPETLYAGPVLNAGRYVDESDAWDTKMGGGGKLLVRLGTFYCMLGYAWDLSGSAADGGLVFSVEGTF